MGVGVFVFFLTSPLLPPIAANISSCNIRYVFLFYNTMHAHKYNSLFKECPFTDLLTHMFISVFKPCIDLVFNIKF